MSSLGEAGYIVATGSLAAHCGPVAGAHVPAKPQQCPSSSAHTLLEGGLIVFPRLTPRSATHGSKRFRLGSHPRRLRGRPKQRSCISVTLPLLALLQVPELRMLRNSISNKHGATSTPNFRELNMRQARILVHFGDIGIIDHRRDASSGRLG